MGVGVYNDGWNGSGSLKEEGLANELVGVDEQVLGDGVGVGEEQVGVGEVGEHDEWWEVHVEVEGVGLGAHVQEECVGYEDVLQVGVEDHGEWEGLNEVREAREVAPGDGEGGSLLV